MKHELLRAFTDAEKSYISGQKLSEHLDVSRTAIWKHIEDLRREGYTIEAVPRKGYRLMERPKTLNELEIKAGLTTKAIGQTVIYKKTIPSTQAVAKEAYQAGSPHGTLVVSDEQTGGRGRMARAWQSPAGTSLSISVLVTPDIPLRNAAQITLVTAVATAKALESIIEKPVQIKWPNDIYIDGRKVAGILAEMQAEADRVQMMIVGIGLNVNQEKTEIANNLQEKATSLFLMAEKNFSRTAVLQSLLTSFEYWYEYWIEEGFTMIRGEWEAHALTFEQPVRVIHGKQTVIGKMIGITEEGTLLLKDAHGDVHSIISGDLEEV